MSDLSDPKKIEIRRNQKNQCLPTNSVCDVDINRHFLSHSPYPSCSGADVLLPKALFLFLARPPCFFRQQCCGRLLSQRVQIEVWPRRSGPQQRINGFTFVNTLTVFLQNFTEKKEKNWQHNTSVCPWTKSSCNTMCVNCLTFAQSHIPTHTL